MVAEIQHFNSQETARILGVNVSTVKRWTEEGKLECVKTAGGHRKFLIQHLSSFLERHREKVAKVNLFPLESEQDVAISHYIIKGKFDYLADYVLRQAFDCNRHKLQKVLNGLYLGQFPLHQIYDALITPILRQIGEMWCEGKITTTEEHLATQTIRDSIIRLQGNIQIPGEKIGSVLCLNLSNELHDMGLKMVDHILESRGYKVLFSGQITLVEDVRPAFESFTPDRVYVSMTYIVDVEQIQKEIASLCAIAKPYGSKIFIGGRGADLISYSHPLIQKRLHTFAEIHSV